MKYELNSKQMNPEWNLTKEKPLVNVVNKKQKIKISEEQINSNKMQIQK